MTLLPVRASVQPVLAAQDALADWLPGRGRARADERVVQLRVELVAPAAAPAPTAAAAAHEAEAAPAPRALPSQAVDATIWADGSQALCIAIASDARRVASAYAAAAQALDCPAPRTRLDVRA